MNVVSIMRVVIVGAGAVGSILAALARLKTHRMLRDPDLVRIAVMLYSRTATASCRYLLSHGCRAGSRASCEGLTG